ncbi:GLE1-like [Cinara cedri]|uniref:mRNA export factor GLE1 n=1 Tax=Cinara cedri TaxID=506608 RepID=A0A5E4NTA3_9HEMI|nr:GLE1-like [Cinara cedri]
MTKQETQLTNNQLRNQSLFHTNLNRIHNDLQRVNEYYIPKYDHQVNNGQQSNIENIGHKVPKFLENQKKKPPINFYIELYRITMNEIELTRKTQVQQILNKKVNVWEQKRKDCTIGALSNLSMKSIHPTINEPKKYESDDMTTKLIGINNDKKENNSEIENFTFKINVNRELNSDLKNNYPNINNKLNNIKTELTISPFNINESLSTFKFKMCTHTTSTDISNFSFKNDYNKCKEIKLITTYKFEDEYRHILENHLAIQKYLRKYEDLYFLFLGDDNLKNLRQELIKAINTPVNSISSASSWHMRDKFDKLHALLMCKTVTTGNSSVSVNSHPHALTFCKDTLAKKIIKIGEHVVSVKTGTAFDVASIVVELWQMYPDFGILLYARFKQNCPCLIPHNATRTIGESDEKYYKSLGYSYTDGVVEKQDKYVIRMTGIIRLFASIIVTKTKSGKALGIAQAWIIITATLNLVPQLDITAILLHEMLVITGYHLKKAYSRQFMKIIQYIDTNYMKKIDEVTPIDCVGPVQRLRTLISKIIELGYVNKPKGILPYNFW